MKTHRSHAHNGLDFLLAQTGVSSIPASNALGLSSSGAQLAFEDEFRKQSERLLSIQAQVAQGADGMKSKTGQPFGQSTSRDGGFDKQSERLLSNMASFVQGAAGNQGSSAALVSLSERVSIWLGPSGPSPVEMQAEGLRSFGRSQGLSDVALDAILGREVAQGAAPQALPLTLAQLPAEGAEGAELAASEGISSSLPVTVGGWDQVALSWLSDRWESRAGGVLQRHQASPETFGLGPLGSGKVKIEWTELQEATEIEVSVPDHAAPVTEAFFAARFVSEAPVANAVAGMESERESHLSQEPARSHTAVAASTPPSVQALEVGDQPDFSQQSGPGGSGQQSSGGMGGGAMTGQQLSEKFGELLGRRMVQQIESGNWKVDVELHPDDLGSIQVEMVWQDGQLEAVFSAEQAATRELLDQGLSKLRESLLNNGTSLAYLSVNDEKRRQEQGRPGQRQDRRPDLAEDVEVNEVEQGAKQKAQSSGLDILV